VLYRKYHPSKGEGICFKEQLGCWALIVSDPPDGTGRRVRQVEEQELVAVLQAGEFLEAVMLQGA
jgi:hypothetical protein